MSNIKKIKSALISVFNKDGLEPIVKKLNDYGVTIYSTGGTQKFINELGIDVIAVEKITDYPSILGGRVKTLHPKVFGGILNRQENQKDINEMTDFNIPQIDLVIVDLYPFQKTVDSGANHRDIVEKIDIGGISLIRAAAKNYNDVLCISSVEDYKEFNELISKNNCSFSYEDRKRFAAKSYNISSHYDCAIFNYFNDEENVLKLSEIKGKKLRYGENPHQKGFFFGKFEDIFEKLNGKELSYNNLLDVDSAVNLMNEFTDEFPTFAILKHNNACGLAQRNTLSDAYSSALAGDPISAFGGVLISNYEIDKDTAQKINDLFCEIVVAPKFNIEALKILKNKNKLVLLSQNLIRTSPVSVRTCLNGFLVQDKDILTDSLKSLNNVTIIKPTTSQTNDLLFASKISKHTKSNTIVLVKNMQLIASGTGQTSRVDALNQAIHKSKSFGFDLNGAVMASDAFFPFPDCVEIAEKAGIKAIIQPGGSIKDQLSIDYCNKTKIAMVFTNTRHFKH